MEVMESPDRVDEDISTYYLFLLLEKKYKQHGFFMIEVNLNISDSRLMGTQIMGDIFVSEECMGYYVSWSPQECSHSSHELIWNKWLGQVVISPDIEAINNLLTISISRYDEDRCSTSLL